VKYAILTTSGTIAIYLALKGLGIGPGHRVGVPNLTFIATANAIALTGATPVLLDVIKETLCLDPRALEKTHAMHELDAVVPVHVSGRSAFTFELTSTIEKLKIPIIEDAAEAFASKDPLSGKFLGTIGKAGAFSFSPNKIITSGQGGLIISNDDSIANSVRELKDQGRPTRGTGGADIHHSVGFNFKFTDLQAAVLQGQIEKLANRIQHLKEIYEFYVNHLENQSSLLKFDSNQGEFPLWPDYQINNRAKLEAELDTNSIGYRKIWHPLSTQNPYLKDASSFPESFIASATTLWLPSAFTLDKTKLKRVTDCVNRVNNQL
jgi:perosamine synthetase